MAAKGEWLMDSTLDHNKLHPFVDAFLSVKFGDYSTEDFLEAAFCTADRPITNRLDALTPGGDFVLTCHIGKAPGLFYCVNPFRTDYVHSLSDPEKAIQFGKGFLTEGISRLYTVATEIDEDPITGARISLVEQCRMLDTLIDEGVPVPNTVTLSGDTRGPDFTGINGQVSEGKSLHSGWAVEGLTLAVREKIQTLLAAILGADPTVGNVNRKMRLGGTAVGSFDGSAPPRVQTILYISKVPTDALTMLHALRRVAAARGITDPTAVVASNMAAHAARKGNTNRSTAKNGKPARGEDFDADTLLVETDDGTEAMVTDLLAGHVGSGTIPIHCPYHDDPTPSAFVAMNNGGRPHIHCSDCYQTWFAQSPSLPAFKAVTVNDTHPAADPKGIPSTLTFGSVDHRCQRYLGYITLHKLTFIRSPRETAKSTAIRGLISRYIAAHPKARIVIPVPRRSLVSTIVGQLGHLGFMDYRESGGMEADRIVICLDSLPRLSLHSPPPREAIGLMQPKKWDMVWLDECEQTLRHIDGDTVRKNTTPEQVVGALRTLVQQAEFTIWSDADLGPLTVRTARRFLGADINQSYRDEVLLVNDGHPDRAADLYPTMAALDQHRQEVWGNGNRLAIFCTTKIDAERIAKDLKDERPDSKIVLITSDTSGDHKPFLSDPDGWISQNKPDALVYSPSLGTGVDVAIRDYFDEVLAFVSAGGWTTVWDALQGIERVRHPRNPRRAVWVSKQALWGLTDPEQIYNELLYSTRTDADIAVRYDPQPRGSFIPVPVDEDTARIVADIRAVRAGGQGQIANGIRSEMSRLGWDVRDVDGLDDELEESVTKRLKAEKKAIRSKSIAAIVNAKTMELEKAKEILRSGRRVGPWQLAMARKTILVDYVGIEESEVDERLVKEWISGKLSRNIRNFVAVSALLAGGDKDTRSALAARQVRRWLQTSVGQPTLAGALGLACALKKGFGFDEKFGAPLFHSSSKTIYTKKGCASNEIKGFERVDLGQFKGLPALLNMAGVNLRDGYQDHPHELLGRLLSRMGCSGKAIREHGHTVIDGKRITTSKTTGYMLDIGSFERMAHLSARWERRIIEQANRGKLVPVVDPAVAEYLAELAA